MAERSRPAVPANLQPFVEVLGEEATIRLLLALGGTSVYLGAGTTQRSRVAEVVGVAPARALAAAMSPGKVDLPLGKPWIAAVRASEGHTVVAIARELHATEATVRRWLKQVSTGVSADLAARQLRLF